MIPLATDTGFVHLLSFLLLTQISTSGFLSFVPPNQAAINPSGVSSIVAACDSGNGAFSKINSSTSIPCFHGFCATEHACNINANDTTVMDKKYLFIIYSVQWMLK